MINELIAALGQDKVLQDYEDRYALSTDASYFRIVPEVVVTLTNSAELAQVLAIANRHHVGVTFRAAGTSLSGQAVGDGILVRMAAGAFSQFELDVEQSRATVGVGLRGGEVNRRLHDAELKIGPDPATINVAMIGGIVANNSSGMCCGTSDNAYQTVSDMVFILADGTRVDTADEASVASFRITHHGLLEELSLMANQLKGSNLAATIDKKYRIKNTTGYSLNALVDYSDGLDILIHLIVGSEGTLAFIESVTLDLLPVAKRRAVSLVAFENVEAAAKAISRLQQSSVAAAELLDWRAVKTMQTVPTMPSWLSELSQNSALLLIEVNGEDEQTCQDTIKALNLQKIEGVSYFSGFSFNTADIDNYWAVRKGIFPKVGADRPPGSTVIIEDVAVHYENFAKLCVGLEHLFATYHYDNAVIFGHALDGNLHFIVTPILNSDEAQSHFMSFMEDVVELVLSLDGSLKAEHGTGRAVAPFVEREWGEQAYSLMRQIKMLFDPNQVLNPGVLINADPMAHSKSIKAIPALGGDIDGCIECGFCEPSCPTDRVTYSPRQRIAMIRAGMDADYQVVQSCVQCALCEETCPVGINTASLVQNLKGQGMSWFRRALLRFQANNWSLITRMYRIGAQIFIYVPKSLIGGMRRTGLSRVLPAWLGNVEHRSTTASVKSRPLKTVVRMTSCSERIFGGVDYLADVSRHAGYDLKEIESAENLCCGQWWQSQGDTQHAKGKQDALIAALQRQGVTELVIDSLSCSEAFVDVAAAVNIKVYDPISWLYERVFDQLDLVKQPFSVAVHDGCSGQKLKVNDRLRTLVAACVDEVRQIEGVGCCAGGGAIAYYDPELSEQVHIDLEGAYQRAEVKYGVYANRPCEQNLQRLSGVEHISVARLLFDSLECMQ